MKNLIRDLVNLYGPSGSETRVSDFIADALRPYADTVQTDALGNLICIKKSQSQNGRRIMLSAHMDHIGFMVLGAEKEGFLRVTPVGGIFRVNTVTRHVVFGNGVNGVVTQQPVEENVTPSMKHMYIDIGAGDEAEALRMVNVGDIAVFANDCFPLGEYRLAAPAMDDRVACALLVKVMLDLASESLEDTVMAVFSVQEEVGCRGAQTAAFALEPDIGIALDVTWNGDTPEQKFPAVKLGEGVAVKIKDGMSISNPLLVRELLSAAEKAGVKVQREVLPGGGTDAATIQTSRGGVCAATVSIPCRYVHSACEVIDLRDVEAAEKLLCEYLHGNP